MDGNAILFSYDTRVNEMAFWGVVGGCIILIAAFLIFRKSKRPVVEFRWFLLMVYAVAMVLLTVVLREKPEFPEGFQNTYFASKRALEANVGKEWFVNVLMFVPIGWLLGAVVKGHLWVKILTAGIAFSFLIETMQYVLNKGVADMEDIACNTIGLIAGAFLLIIKTKI